MLTGEKPSSFILCGAETSFTHGEIFEVFSFVFNDSSMDESTCNSPTPLFSWRVEETETNRYESEWVIEGGD